MSEWYDINQDCVSIDREGKEVDIFVHQDNFGSVYAVITFEEIERIYNAIQDINHET